jgi:hypothetical protein
MERAKGAFVSESALHIFDGDKPNSVGSPWRPDDHLSHLIPQSREECPMSVGGQRLPLQHRDATIPEDL